VSLVLFFLQLTKHSHSSSLQRFRHMPGTEFALQIIAVADTTALALRSCHPRGHASLAYRRHFHPP